MLRAVTNGKYGSTTDHRVDLVHPNIEEQAHGPGQTHELVAQPDCRHRRLTERIGAQRGEGVADVYQQGVGQRRSMARASAPVTGMLSQDGGYASRDPRCRPRVEAGRSGRVSPGRGASCRNHPQKAR